jgi:transposase
MIDLLLDALARTPARAFPSRLRRPPRRGRSVQSACAAFGQARTNQTPSGKRGRTKQSGPANLLRRRRQYNDAVLRFMTDPGVPFSHNLAEQAVRMPKVKQKISGGFRTETGVRAFGISRSYLATLHKQGANLFQALVLTFQGCPPQPRFA